MPKQSSQSGFKTGWNCGGLVGVLVGMGMPYLTVTPVVWKRELHLTQQAKEASVLFVKARWPEVQLNSHDEADAICLAYYGGQR